MSCKCISFTKIIIPVNQLKKKMTLNLIMLSDAHIREELLRFSVVDLDRGSDVMLKWAGYHFFFFF